MKSIREQFIFHKNNIPLVKLITIRSDSGTQLPDGVTDFRNDRLFIELPVFPTKNIKDFFNSLQNQNTIQKSLEILNFNMNYNNQFIDNIYKSLHSKTTVTDASIFYFIYQCLAFIRLNDSLRTESEYILIFNVMNLTITSPFHVFYTDIFKELLTDLLSKFNIEWDINLLNTILRQIVSNNSFDSTFSECLENLILKIVSTKNSAMVETLLSVLVIFFEENKPSVKNISCSTIISSITNYISNIDLNSLVVLGYCSQKEPNNITIIYRYQSLIRNTLSLLSRHPPIYQPSTFFPNSQKTGEITDDEGEISEESTFEAPPENLIHCESNIDDICCKQLKLYSTRFQSLLTLSSKPSIDTFIQSIIDTQKIIEISVYTIDMSILIASCLECLAKQTRIDPLIQYFIKSKIFDPNYSIFSKEGLNPTISIIRNSIFKIISTINSSFFYNFIQSATLHPLLLAEHIMRLSYKYGNMFFAHTIILNSLLESINVLQIESSSLQSSHQETAKKVILSVVISLLDESDFAFVFFSDNQFCNLFTHLLIEPTTTEIATSVFAKSVSKFPSLPDSTIQFISLILKKCNTKPGDESTTNGAISLVKAINSAISHKISLGISVSIIFDETLKFLKNYIDRNPETLEMTMAICALITQSQSSIEVNPERYNSILDIIQKIEGNEPSDSTLQSFLNQLNASTNTGIDQMFLIQTSNVIPIILASFSQSKRLGMIIDLFQQLCLFSVKNIIALHEGDLSFILLKALAGGPFTYKERNLNFLIPKEIIESIFRLISNVVSYRSSFLINETFLNLIYPDPLTHQFLPVAEQATMSLYQLFTQQDKSVFQICTESPVYIIKDVDGTALCEGFAFSFLAKVDLTSMIKRQGSFVYLEIKDVKKRILRISQQQDSLLANYITPTLNVLQTMTIPITSNKWFCITVFFYFEDNQTIICFKAGNKISDDAKFKSIIFEKDVEISIGFTKSATISPSELSPVSMNHFALFLPPFDDRWFDSISSNGFIELSHFTNIAFHNHSKNTLINAIAKRRNLSITTLLPLHSKLSDFIEIFKYSYSQSSLFKELALRSVFLFTNCMNKSKSGAAFAFLPTNLIHLDKLESFTHVPESVLKKFYRFSENLFTVHMTDLSIFFSSFILTNTQNETFFLPIALELIELTTDTEFHIELFESVILNIWLWCSSTEQATFKKNLRSLTHFLTQYSFPSNFGSECLFSEFLIQSHFLCNYSTEPFSFIDSYRFRILESIPITYKDIEIITSIIIYNYRNRDKQLFKEEGMTKYCMNEDKRMNEIINYIEFLTLISSLKHLIFQKKVLLALTDIVSNSPIHIIEKLIDLLKVAAGDNLHDCFLDIALKSDDLKVFDLLDDSFDIICIQTIRSQSTDKFFMFINDKSKSLKNNELWWFWLSLTAVITQKKEITNVIISNIIHNDVSTIFSFYSLFLSIFSILRLTKVFPHVNEIMNWIISGVLESIIKMKNVIPNSIQNSIAILSLFAMFHKLRNIIVPSKAILYLINEFDDFDYYFKNKKSYRKINNQNSTNQLKNVFYPNNFTLTNLKIIFGSSNLEKYQFKFWLSHTKPLKMKSIRYIKTILDNKNSSNDSSLNNINKFIIKLIDSTKNNDSDVKIDLHTAELVFPNFISNNDNNVILNEMKRQVSFCWTVIKSFLSNSLHNFDYETVFFPQVSFELFRFSKLFTSSTLQDKDKKSDNNFVNVPISRFTKFPFLFRFKKLVSNLKLESAESSINRLDNLNLNSSSTKSTEVSLCSSNLLYTSSFSSYPLTNSVQPLLSFPCHIITQNDQQQATFMILRNEFRLLQLAKPLISIPFNTIKCMSTFRTGFIEIFLSAFNSFLLEMNKDDINNLKSYLNSFSLFSSSSSNFMSNDLLPFPLLSDGSQIEAMLVDNQALKSMSVFDTVFANILALNFAKGRSFNDLSYYPLFPLIWNGKFLSDTMKVVQNIEYARFLHFWMMKFSQIENKIADDICTCNKNGKIKTKSNDSETTNNADKKQKTEKNEQKIRDSNSKISTNNSNINDNSSINSISSQISANNSNANDNSSISASNSNANDNSSQISSNNSNANDNSSINNSNSRISASNSNLNNENSIINDNSSNISASNSNIDSSNGLSPTSLAAASLNSQEPHKFDFNEFLLMMPKCAVPHLFNCNCNFVSEFSNISERDMIIHIYHNKKIIEKKTFRKLIVKWLQSQFNTTFNLKRNSKSLENSFSSFFEDKLSLTKKDPSKDLITLKRTRRVRFCKFFDGNKDAFSCIVEKKITDRNQQKPILGHKNKEDKKTETEKNILTMKVFSLAGIKSSINDGPLNSSSLSSNGIVELTIQNYMKVPIVFDPSHDLLFCVLRHLVVVINRTRCIGHLIFIPSMIYEFAIPTNITGVCGVDNTLILIVDDSIIIACNIEKFPEIDNKTKSECNDNSFDSNSSCSTVVLIDDEGQIQNQLIKNVVRCEVNKIVIFTSSTIYSVLVYQTNDLKLKVLSIFDSIFLSEIQLSKKIDKLLITEENGFICCFFDDEVVIYTLNGNLINKNKIKSKFVVVTHCRSPKGIDFILYINEKGDLGMFEAFSPMERKVLLSGLKDVLEMRVCKRKPVLILILKSGEILSYPISFKILFELCL